MSGQNQDIKQVRGIVNSVTVKTSGTTNGRNWTIYEVVISNEQYSTFDAGFKELIGQEGTFNYTEKENVSSDGRVFINKTLLALKKPEAPQGGVGQTQGLQPPQPGYQPKMVSVSEAVINSLIANQQKIMKALKIDEAPKPPESEIPILEEPLPPPGY